MKVVVGQGSCGIATGAKKTAGRFEQLIREKNLDIKADIVEIINIVFLRFSLYLSL